MFADCLQIGPTCLQIGVMCLQVLLLIGANVHRLGRRVANLG